MVFDAKSDLIIAIPELRDGFLIYCRRLIARFAS